MTRPLEGLRVLDLSRLLPGPFATLILSDLGADIVKVEDLGAGDYLRVVPPLLPAQGGAAPMSARFAAINRDKRSIALDLKNAAGRDAFVRLSRRADVVVESFRPGVLDRLGIGYGVLAAENPGIILCSISGYGQTGPYRDRAGHDVNYIALAGVLAMTGTAGGPPVLPGAQIADVAGGGLWGAVGVCAALAGRAATGRGRHLDVSMTEGALAFLLPELGAWMAGGSAPRRGREGLHGGRAAYGVYETLDGKYLSVGALEPKFWNALGAAIGRPCELFEIGASPAEQAKIRDELTTIFRTRMQKEWVEIFAGVDACVEPVLEVDELAAHPLHEARQLFYTMEPGGLGQVRTPLGEPHARRPPPAQGEHTAEVLGEAGFSDTEIEALRAARAIG